MTEEDLDYLYERPHAPESVMREAPHKMACASRIGDTCNCRGLPTRGNSGESVDPKTPPPSTERGTCDHLWVAGGLAADWVCEHCGGTSTLV